MSSPLADYRQQIPDVQRALEGGSSIRGAARDFGVPEGTIRQWILSGRVTPPGGQDQAVREGGEDSESGDDLGKSFHNAPRTTVEADPAAGMETMTAEEMADYEARKRSIREKSAAVAGWLEDILWVRRTCSYRCEFATFPEFLKATGAGVTARRFYQLAEGHEVAKNLTAAGLPAPANDAQARALAGLPRRQQAEAWQRANEATGGKPTARDVGEAAAAVAAEHAPPRNGRAKPPRPAREPEPPGVWEDVTTEPPEPAAPPEPSEDELGDDAWLARMEVRGKLTPAARERFDRDALLYRGLEALVSEFADKVRPVLNRARKEGGYQGPYHNRVVWFLKTEHPAFWRPCGECKGEDGLSAGEIRLVGRCPACKGGGYRP